MEYVIADLHFGDENIRKYENRPFVSTDEMDKALIHNWNSVITPKDIVYVLGDVSFYDKERTVKLIKSLKGTKVLVMGNHDWEHSEQYWRDVGFDSAYRQQGILIHNWLWLCHQPPEYTMKEMPWRIAYGHVHSSEIYPTITKNTVCVCAERWDYTPVAIKYIEGLWNTIK